MKTVVFDFGNVLAFFDHGRALAELVRYAPLPATELALILYGSPLEDGYERGRITTTEYVRLATLNGRLTCSEDVFRTAYANIFWRNDEVCDLVPRLRRRHRLLLASNTNELHYARFRQQFADVLAAENFDAICLSHEAGARKPEAAFFAYCQRFAGADPGECVFVDDLPANVEAARTHGWHGIVYRPGGDLAGQLAAAGVQIG